MGGMGKKLYTHARRLNAQNVSGVIVCEYNQFGCVQVLAVTQRMDSGVTELTESVCHQEGTPLRVK